MVVLYRMPPKERYLSAEEMAQLNAVLARDEFRRPHVIAIVRLLMLTGCRFGEVVSPEWSWIKGRRIQLPDSKSGPRTVRLSSAARAVIDAIPRYSPDCPFLFPARSPTRHVDNIAVQWQRIRNEGRLARLAASRPASLLGLGGRRPRHQHGDHRQAPGPRPR